MGTSISSCCQGPSPTPSLSNIRVLGANQQHDQNTVLIDIIKSSNMSDRSRQELAHMVAIMRR